MDMETLSTLDTLGKTSQKFTLSSANSVKLNHKVKDAQGAVCSGLRGGHYLIFIQSKMLKFPLPRDSRTALLKSIQLHTSTLKF